MYKLCLEDKHPILKLPHGKLGLRICLAAVLWQTCKKAHADYITVIRYSQDEGPYPYHQPNEQPFSRSVRRSCEDRKENEVGLFFENLNNLETHVISVYKVIAKFWFIDIYVGDPRSYANTSIF